MGLIIVESCGVEYPLGVHHIPVHLHLEDDKYIPGYRELTEVIHNYECPCFLQLFHSGPWHPKAVSGLTPVTSSALSPQQLEELRLGELKELTVPEIEGLVEKFAGAAVRAEKAGFDGVEINANSTHLINTFLSPVWNHRQDDYGAADLNTRSKSLTDIIRETKRLAGPDFAVVDAAVATGLHAQRLFTRLQPAPAHIAHTAREGNQIGIDGPERAGDRTGAAAGAEHIRPFQNARVMRLARDFLQRPARTRRHTRSPLAPPADQGEPNHLQQCVESLVLRMMLVRAQDVGLLLRSRFRQVDDQLRTHSPSTLSAFHANPISSGTC